MTQNKLSPRSLSVLQLARAALKENKGFFRLLLLGALLAVGPALAVLFSAYFPLFSKGSLAPLEPVKPVETFFSSQDKRVYWLAYTDRIQLSSRVIPAQLEPFVRLGVNGEDVTPKLIFDRFGGFRVETPLVPYRNTVSATGPWGARETVEVFFLPGRGDPFVPPPVTRALSLTLQTHQAEAVYTAVFSTSLDLPDFQDLQKGAISPDLLLKRFFYPANAKWTGREYTALVSEYTVGPETTLVKLTAVLDPGKLSAEHLDRLLSVTPQPDGSVAATRIEIRLVSPLALEGTPLPWPDEWQGSRLVWADPAEPISVRYRSSVLSPGRVPLAGRVQEGLGAFLARMTGALSFLIPIIPVVPFLWVLGFAETRAMYPAEHRRQLILLGFAALGWVVPLLAFIFPLADLLHRLLGRLYKALPFLPDFPPVLPQYPQEWALWAAAVTTAVGLAAVYGDARGMRRLSVPRLAGWALAAAAVLLMNLGLLLLEGYFSVLFWPSTVLVLGAWAGLARALARPPRAAFQGAWTILLGLGLLALLAGYPVRATTAAFRPASGWGLDQFRVFYLMFGSILLPYMLFASLGWLARTRRRDMVLVGEAPIHPLFGRLVFAAFTVGIFGAGIGTVRWVEGNFLPFLLAAIWVFPLMLNPRQVEKLLRLPKVTKQLALRPPDWARMRRRHWQAVENAGEESKKLPEDYAVRQALLAFGPIKEVWQNTRQALGYSLLLTTLLFLAYLPLLWERALQVINTPFPVLQAVGVFILPFYARWLSAAFLLGVLFPYLRGRNGLQKGLVLGTAISICVLPGNTLLLAATLGDPLALLWDTGQTLLFTTLLGVLAFDLQHLRGYGLGWRALMREYGLAFLVPYLSTLGGSVGLAITSILSGRSETILQSMLELLLRGAPGAFGGG